jgi:hypothetical protein
MRILARLTLLSLFAATGVALAVYVGSATGPSPETRASAQTVEPRPADEGQNATTANGPGAPQLEQDRPGKSSQADLGESQQDIGVADSSPYTPGNAARALPYGDVGRTRSETSGPLAGTSPQADVPAAGPEADSSAGFGSAPPAITIPEGALLAEPRPPRTLAASGDLGSRLPKSLRLWKALATPFLGQVGGDGDSPAHSVGGPQPPTDGREIVATPPAV